MYSTYSTRSQLAFLWCSLPLLKSLLWDGYLELIDLTPCFPRWLDIGRHFGGAFVGNISHQVCSS